MKEFFDRLFSGGFSWDYFIEPFRGFGVRDALDILLLSALFFAVFTFVRKRRAGRLLWGMGLLAGFYALSQFLNFYGMRYLFGNFFGFGLLMLVVVFQPEIRALVERLGSFSVRDLKNIHTGMSTPTLDALVLGVKNLSFTKTGALIVIEKSIRLGGPANGDVVLNAEISAELLEAIFNKKSPIHDGAVIIRNGRIFLARHHLDLTDKEEVIKDLGTRHCAALAASQTSDAVVVVVSEEDGTISIAHNAIMTRDHRTTNLRDELGELLGLRTEVHPTNEELK